MMFVPVNHGGSGFDFNSIPFHPRNWTYELKKSIKHVCHYTSSIYPLNPNPWVGTRTSSSSTAQGGGGSFKDRKPISEVVCCESWIGKRTHCIDGPKRGWSVGLHVCLSTYLYICLYICLFVCLSICIHLPIYLSVYLSTCLSFCLSVCYLSICRSFYLGICLLFYLYVCLSLYLSFCLSICYLSIICLSVYLPVFLQDWKRSCSVSLGWDLKVESWNTKLETSPKIEVVNIKTKAILQDFLQTWKVEY